MSRVLINVDDSSGSSIEVPDKVLRRAYKRGYLEIRVKGWDGEYIVVGVALMKLERRRDEGP